MRQELNNDSMTLKLKWLKRVFLDGGEGENNHVPVKERFGEEEKKTTGLQHPSVSSQVKFGAVWADKKSIPDPDGSSLS